MQLKSMSYPKNPKLITLLKKLPRRSAQSLKNLLGLVILMETHHVLNQSLRGDTLSALNTTRTLVLFLKEGAGISTLRHLTM